MHAAAAVTHVNFASASAAPRGPSRRAAAAQPRFRSLGARSTAVLARHAARPTTPSPPGRRSLRCTAAVDQSDAIDVEGKVVDDRVPVTVGSGA